MERAVTKPGAKLPYEDTRIAKLLRDRIDRLASQKTQREIAAEIGYDKPNVLSMYKRGEAKVPLDRIPAFAKALDLDTATLFRLGLEQWWPGSEKEIRKMFSERILTVNEQKWLVALRETYGDDDPAPTPERLQALASIRDSEKTY